jgi:D-3-phosphoglycerate dehydrogenase
MTGDLVLALDPVGDDLEPERAVLSPFGLTVESVSSDERERDSQLSRARALLLNRTRVDATLLDQAPRCRAIATYGTGHDHIDLQAAKARGIIVVNVTDYCTGEVADHTMAMLLSLARGLSEGGAIVRRGDWGLDGLKPLRRIAGQTLGLVGFGRIARAVANRANAFGLRVQTFDPYMPDSARPIDVVRKASLADLLVGADWVSLHLPLVPETQNLIDSGALATMKPRSHLINTSRGGLVDLPALLVALESGHLAGAALDVFADEPPGRIEAAPSRLLLTPHAAYYSVESIAELKHAAAHGVATALSGQEVLNRLI